MRNTTLVILLIALVCAFTFSVTGQEEALPPVQPRLASSADLGAADSLPGAPFLDLAAEPISQFREPTLAEAAEQNDFVTFDALYRSARARGQSVAPFETLHEVWTFALTDPIGAFYGAEMHDRLARAYPSYAAYIEPYEIVDDNGGVFYPTSETRTFLLEQARKGDLPRVQIAERRPASRPAPAAASRPAIAPARTPAAPVSAASTTPSPVPSQAADPAAAEVATAAPHQVTIPAITPQAPQAVPVPIPARDNRRGLLMLITGLVTLALIAVIMRLQRPTARVAQ